VDPGLAIRYAQAFRIDADWHECCVRGHKRLMCYGITGIFDPYLVAPLQQNASDEV
jgi:hypothetical protein